MVEEEKRLRKEKIWRVVKWSGTVGIISFVLAVIGQHEGKKNDALLVTPPPQVVASPSPDDKGIDINQPAPPTVQPDPQVVAPSAPAQPVQIAFPEVNPDVAYRELYGDQPPTVLSQYILKGTPIPFVQGVYPFSGTQGRNYLVALGVSKSEKDQQLYIDAQIYKKVDGGWTPYGKGSQLLAVVNERLPVGQPSPVETVAAENGQVTLGLRLDYFVENGQSSSAMIKLVRFAEEEQKLSMLKPTAMKSGKDGNLQMPRSVNIGGKMGYVIEDKNPRFHSESFYFDDSSSYVCNMVRNPDTGVVNQDSCKEKGIVITPATSLLR